jgi:hypothetical protein
VDFRTGGAFHTSIVSGVFARIGGDAVGGDPVGGDTVGGDAVGGDAVGLVLASGAQVTLTVGGSGMAGTLTVSYDRDGPMWTAGLDALAPTDGRTGADVDERQSYNDWLDFYRTVIPGKLAGLSEADARRSLVGSATTLLGLAKHLTGVERNWFQVILDRRSREEVGPNNRGGDDSWQLGSDDTIASVIAAYDTACATSRRIAVRHDLSERVPDGHAGEISLRTIYVHMIEEIARHAGHADILRELIDGATGLDPLAG